jgi:hypothetical protein
VPHGHARAAANLRVRESELLLALDGHGVHTLHTDLAALLAPATQWGRIVAEVHHSQGYACLGLTPTQVRHDDGRVVLFEPDRQLLLASNAFVDCFLVHGAGACGIHGFDERGELVARLHLVSTAACAIKQSLAMQHLLAHASAPGQRPAAESPAAGGQLTRPGWCAIERQINAPESVAELCRLLNVALDDAPALQFAMESEAAILACQSTPLHKAGPHPTVSTGLRDCKLHLRSASVRHATVCTGPDGRPFLRLHSVEGNCLRFQHAGNPLESRAWLESLLLRRV